MGLFGKPTQIGVSIGSSSVKIAELKKSGKSYSLEHFGVAQLQDEAISNREIINHMAVVDSVRGLVDQLKIKGRSVITSLSGAFVIVKKILLEQTSMKELGDAILWEAEQYVPFDINEVVYDYQLLNKNGPEGKMEIMLVACKRATIESYQAVLKDAGLTTSTIDVDLFALQNAFEFNYSPDSTVALVDIGASSLKLVICSGGQPTFTRDTAIGGRALTAEIQKHLNLSYQEAELLKIDGNAEGQVPQEVADLIHVTCENFAAEIKRSLDFYAASNVGAPVSMVLLAGGCSKLPNLTGIVQATSGIATQLINPFTKISYDAKIFNQDYIDAISGMAAIPVGLALRGFLK
ncbi:MAG: type IV pilus assembly protein PilM [Bdellovibrionota bacterium]